MAPDEPTAEDSIYGGSAGRPSRGYRAEGEPTPEPELAPETVEDQPEPVEAEDEGQTEDSGPVPEFPEKHREAFQGLLYLGYLEDTLEWAGHSFVVRTLTAGQHIKIGMLVKPYLGTRVEGRAYQAAMAACGTVLVDGKPLYEPIGPMASDEVARLKFEYVLEKWFPPTVNAVQAKIQELEILSREILDAMGKASG